MATLGELPEKERKELARELAKEIWFGVEHYGELPGTLDETVGMLLSKQGLLHESNFYSGAINEEAQNAKLKEFHDLRDELCDYGEQYDALVAPLEKDLPGFVRKSEELRRTYLTLHILRELCKPESPFSTLRVADAIDDQDRSDESNDDNDDDDDDDDYDDYDENSDESGGEGESDESDETEESDSESNKVLDKADEAEASDSGSESESECEDPPPKRKKSERAAAAAAASTAQRSPSPVCAGDDSDLSDA